MLGKKFAGKGAPKPSGFEKGVKDRLAHLERCAEDAKKQKRPFINLTPLVQRLDSLEMALGGYREQLAAVPKNGAAANSMRLDRLEDQLGEIKIALTKLPPNGGLVVKVSSLERVTSELEDKFENFGKVLANISGLSGETGRIGALEKRADSVDEKLDRLSSIHYKLLALGTAGAFIGGLAFSLAKWLL
jgi:chaperonin cofactor prefoldin